jgi:hypothetical protein
MDEKTSHELDALLADGKVSGPEADAIFDRVYATVARDERRWARWRPVLYPVGAVAACAAVALAWSTGPSGELTARGAETIAPVLEVTCAAGSLAACPHSSKLVFVVSGEGVHGALSAYAEPLDGQGERILYFTREAGAPALTAGDGTRVFHRAVMLAGTHRAGRYRIHAVLTDRPLDRNELLQGPPEESIKASLSTEISVTGE